MQMRLNDVVVNESTKFQCQEPTEPSHTILMRGNDVDEVSIIPLELNGLVYCLPTFNLSQYEFNICDRYELIFESTEYEPSSKTLSEQLAPSVHSPSEGDVNHEANCEVSSLSFKSSISGILEAGTSSSS
jgi:hypothetical protein